MWILLSLPFISFYFIYAIVWNRYKHSGDSGWRHSFLISCVFFGALIILFTEALSLFRLISFAGILIGWFVVLIGLGLYIFLHGISFPIPKLSNFIKLDFWSKAIIVFISFIFAVLLLVVILSFPNNWDAMVYHLARIFHWIQNNSINHYPTHLVRQVLWSPFNSFAMLHAMLLTGTDRLVNIVQLASTAGMVIGVSAIARELGAKKKVQIISALIAITVPSVLVQAVSSQNDTIVALWLVICMYFVLLLRKKFNLQYVILAGLSLGLAIFTKGSAYLLCMPIIAWFVVCGLKKRKWYVLEGTLIIICIALLVNIGLYLRNYDVFGNPVLSGIQREWNMSFKPNSLLSTWSKHLSFELATPFPKINQATTKVFERFHDIIGVDINDPTLTLHPEEGKFYVYSYYPHENQSSSPLHFLLIIATFLLLIIKRKRLQGTVIIPYVAVVISMWFLLATFTGWSPWSERYYITIFALWAPAFAIILARFSKPFIFKLVLIVLAIFSLNAVFWSSSKPLLGKLTMFNLSEVDYYFVNRPMLRNQFVQAIDFVEQNNCNDIGVNLLGNSWEYALVKLKQMQSNKPFRIEHVDVLNSTRAKSSVLDNFSPCAIICHECDETARKEYIKKYKSKMRIFDDTYVFITPVQK